MNYHLKSFGAQSTKPILILHGWGIDGSYFYETAKLLSVPSSFKACPEQSRGRGGLGWRSHPSHVLVPDLPGFGKTPEPPTPWSIDDYAQWVTKLLNHLKIKKVTILGHSFGGSIAIKLAATHPHLVEKLILTGAAGVESLNLKRSTKRLTYLIISKLLKWLTFIPLVRRVKDRFYLNRDYGKVTGTMRETFKKVIKRNLTADCRKITCPTLLLWGKNDRLTPISDGQKITKLIPNSKLIAFENVGHKLPYEKPKDVAKAILDFLDAKEYNSTRP